MAFTIAVFARKMQELRGALAQDIDAVAAASGIAPARLRELERGDVEPTGDEVLMLAHFYKRDFRFFISDDAIDPTKEASILFREHGGDLRPADRMAIAEFAYLCGCQAFLEREMNRKVPHPDFHFRATGDYYKGHGERCARELRKHLGLADNEVARDIYECMRQMGFKVFRRRLENSTISGLFMHHPEAGPCVLVNLAEGQARQRFSAAHEWAHGLLDNKAATLSKVSELTNTDDLLEVRANAFASGFLIPPARLLTGDRKRWTDPNEIAGWAGRMRVSVPALLAALVGAKLLTREQRDTIRALVPRVPEPVDPELEGLNETRAARKTGLLARGLSAPYVNLAFAAYSAEKISRGLLADMLLTSSGELPEVARLFGRALRHD